MSTPVVVFAYRRPQLTLQVLERVRQARPDTLFLVADGAIGNGDEGAVSQVREVLDGVDWCTDVRRNYADANLGLGTRVVTGIDWVFEQVEEAIFLEDDVLPGPEFFVFCTLMLARYRSEPRVKHISGHRMVEAPPAYRDRAYVYTSMPNPWGYATWRRAWQSGEFSFLRSAAARSLNEQNVPLYLSWLRSERSPWPGVDDNPVLRSRLRRCGQFSWQWMKLARLQLIATSWDGDWMFSINKTDSLVVSSTQNLVINIGFDAQATNTKTTHNRAVTRRLGVLPLDRTAPTPFAVDEAYQALCARRMDGDWLPGTTSRDAPRDAPGDA